MKDLLMAFYGDDFTGSADAMEALTLNGVPTVLERKAMRIRRMSFVALAKKDLKINTNFRLVLAKLSLAHGVPPSD